MITTRGTVFELITDDKDILYIETSRLLIGDKQIVIKLPPITVDKEIINSLNYLNSKTYVYYINNNLYKQVLPYSHR